MRRLVRRSAEAAREPLRHPGARVSEIAQATTEEAAGAAEALNG